MLFAGLTTAINNYGCQLVNNNIETVSDSYSLFLMSFSSFFMRLDSWSKLKGPDRNVRDGAVFSLAVDRG